MRFDSRQAAQWLVRAAVAAATAWAAVLVVQAMQDKGKKPTSGLMQATALRSVDRTLAPPQNLAPRFSLVYFGDSLAMSENPILGGERGAPRLLATALGKMVAEAGTGEPSDLRLYSLTHSGLSTWSLYYMTDKIVGLRPDYVVIEFNLYNFSRFWQTRDRRILGAMLPLRRLPEMLTLPTGATGLAMDEWAFSKLVLGIGMVPAWEAVQHQQELATNWYWKLGDQMQQLVGADKLVFRQLNYFEAMRKVQISDTKRATAEYARKLFGPSLSGVEPDNSTMKMYVASLEKLRAAGVPMLVYVPPYNLQHLNELGVLSGGQLVETIELVREVTERYGARFVDAHDLLDDKYFRDAMDHLKESEEANGHRLLAQQLIAAIADDWRRIVATPR